MASTFVYDEDDGRKSIFIYLPKWVEKTLVKDLLAELDATKDNEWFQGRGIGGNKTPRLVRWHEDDYLSYRFSGETVKASKWTPTVLRLKAVIADKVPDLLAKYADYDTHQDLNSVLINKYRTENDSVSAHSDDEPAFSLNPTIASVSIGASRNFTVRRMTDEKRKTIWAGRVKTLDSYIDVLSKLSKVTKDAEEADEYKGMLQSAKTSRALIYHAKASKKHEGIKLSFVLGEGDLLIMAGAAQDFWLHEVPKAKGRTTGRRYNFTFRPFLIPPLADLRSLL